MTIWLVSAILIITLYLLISEKIPVDLTAIGIMAMLMISRVLTPVEAVAGFAHPAVITVGAMFLVSKGLVRTFDAGCSHRSRRYCFSAGRRTANYARSFKSNL